MKLTEKRRAYLERLLDGPRLRDGSKGNTGYACMQAGWTEWDFRANGEVISKEEWFRRARADEPRDDNYEERLTPAGRAALSQEGE